MCGGALLRAAGPVVSGIDNVNIYRIPALIVSPKGTLLAFCEAREVNPGPGAYSSLAVLADGATIGLLYETGASHPYEKISFARFNLEWLTAKPSGK